MNLQVSRIFISFVVFTFLSLLPSSTTASTLSLDPDETKSLSEIITSHGFILQEYHVLTEDGYILTIHRAVPRNFNPLFYNVFRKPVIAFHGLLTDSANFYINSPHLNAPDSCGDNFGFCMLKSGRYDLWVPNSRGNRYSQHHIRWTTKDKQFWMYDWDHIAKYDIPAFIDLVREITRHRTVGYIGYSQGGASMFALLTEQPKYASIIRPYIAWAPAVFIGNMISIMRNTLSIEAQVLPHLPGQHPMSTSLVNNAFQFGLCRGIVGNEFCSTFLSVIMGPTDSTNSTRTPVVFKHFPSGCSNWQMAHFGQSVVTGKFAHFDYGSKETNMRIYGKPSPPEYRLQNIPRHLKLVIMYGQTDWLVSEKDTLKLIGILRNSGINVIAHKIPAKKWNHFSFTGAQGVGRLVYDETIRYLDRFAWN